MVEKRSLINSEGCEKTRFALFWMNIANEPMISLYTLAPFLLRKELHIDLMWISLFTTLRPILTVFSSYWNSLLPYKKNKLLSYLTRSYFLAYVPFVLLPIISSPIYFFIACALYQLFYRASTPAFIEILQQKLPKSKREQSVALAYIISFGLSCICGESIGKVLDKGWLDWKYLFFLSALVGLSSIFFQKKISLSSQEDLTPPPLKERVLLPWKQSFRLLSTRQDFAIFQWGFMAGGFSLMLIAPALSIYYVDTLHLSYTEMSNARFVFMGIGIILSSWFWRKGLVEETINYYTTFILLGFGLFPLALLLATYNLMWLYSAFFLYGIFQAGSHLIWNLSGTVFSKEKDSYLFTNVNLLMLGLRGIVAPMLGGILCKISGPKLVLCVSAVICFIGFTATFSSIRAVSKKKLLEQAKI